MKRGWTTVALKDVITEARPGFASGADIPDGVLQLRMNNVTADGTLDFSKQRRVPVDARTCRFELQIGDVLFNATNSPDLVGKTALFAGRDEPVVYSNHFLRLRADERRLVPAYLASWMQFQHGRGVFGAMSHQWVNQAAVHPERLLNIEIPLPPLDEQRRVARTLHAARDLLKHHRRALPLTLAFLESQYVSTCGRITDARWPQMRLDELATVTTGTTPPRADSANYGHFVDWVKNENVQTDWPYVTAAQEGLSEQGAARARIAQAGSVLVTCISGSPAAIGRVALSDRPLAFNQQINSVTPHEMEPSVLYLQLRMARDRIQLLSTGGMKGMISKTALRGLKVSAPTAEAQAAVSEAFARGAAHASLLREREQRITALFASVQHQAFTRGL